MRYLCIEGVRKLFCREATMSGMEIKWSKKRVYPARAAKMNKKLKKARLDLSASQDPGPSTSIVDDDSVLHETEDEPTRGFKRERTRE